MKKSWLETFHLCVGEKEGSFIFREKWLQFFNSYQVLTEKVCQCNFETCNSSCYPDFFWIIFQILQVGNLSLSWTFYGSLSFILKSTVQVSDKIVNFIHSCIFCSIQMEGSVSSRQNCVLEKWYGYYQRETPVPICLPPVKPCWTGLIKSGWVTI